MLYDTLHRHNDALAAGPVTSLGHALHALNMAVSDCRRAGKTVERDAAVLMLMRALGESAARAEPDLEAVRHRCAADREAIIASPAMLAIAGHRVGGIPAAKRSFHADARRALLRLAAALGFAEADYRIVISPGADHEDGVTELRHARLAVRIVPRGFLPDNEVSFFRCTCGEPAGPVHHAAIAALLDPEALCHRIEAALGAGSRLLPIAA